MKRENNVKCNYHRYLMLHSASQHFTTSFSLLFSCLAATLMMWFTLTALFQPQQAAVLQQTHHPREHYLLSTKQEMDIVCDKHNIVEYLAAEESDTSLWSW